jgi:hypothetical protein
MQVAELWRLTVGWCGIKGRQSVVCLRVACRSDTVRCAQSAAPRRRWKSQCRWGSDRPTLAVQSQVGERLFISHYFGSRVEHFVSSKLVLCLTAREEWRRCPLWQPTSRACCERCYRIGTLLVVPVLFGSVVAIRMCQYLYRCIYSCMQATPQFLSLTI